MIDLEPIPGGGARVCISLKDERLARRLADLLVEATGSLSVDGLTLVDVLSVPAPILATIIEAEAALRGRPGTYGIEVNAGEKDFRTVTYAPPKKTRRSAHSGAAKKESIP